MTRLGFIVPSSNTTMEPEFYAMLPEGFTVHTARLKLERVTVESLAKMEEGIEEEASKLADADVNAIGFGCTSSSLLKGLGHDKMTEEKIEKISGKPAVATAGAVVAALKALGVNKVAVLKHEEADGIFIGCTNLPTIKIIQKLENFLKKPVIPSNTATLWVMLKNCGISMKIKGYGKLLEENE